MIELCDGKSKALVTSSTSYCVEHPPSCISDGKLNTYWISTGLFPQEVSIALSERATIKRMEIVCMGIKSLELSKSDQSNAANWDTLSAKCNADDADGAIQRLSPEISAADCKASHVRIRILSGFSDIISIFKVNIIGTPVEADSSTGKSGHISAGPGSLSSRLAAGSSSNSPQGSPMHRK